MSKRQDRPICEFTGGVGCPKLEGTPVTKKETSKKVETKAPPDKKKKKK